MRFNYEQWQKKQRAKLREPERPRDVLGALRQAAQDRKRNRKPPEEPRKGF